MDIASTPIDKPCATTAWLAVVLVIVLLPAAYMGAYYAMLRTLTVHEWIEGRKPPVYRFGGPAAETFFRPAREADELIRR